VASGRRAHHGLDEVRGDGEADAGGTARGRHDHAVDADKLTVHVDQRATGIARIDGGVGLDEILVLGLVAGHMSEGRDDAAGDRLADAEGIADGQHQVADLDLVRIGEAEGRQIRARPGDLQHGQIGPLVLEHDIGREFALVRQRHLDLIGVLDDVEIGHDQARRVDDDAGAERPLDALAWRAAKIAEEAAEERIGEEGRDLLLDHARGIDVDHRGRDPLDHRGE
jgi:hypothetical protein